MTLVTQRGTGVALHNALVGGDPDKPRRVRVRLFGTVDFEGPGLDRSVELTPTSRALLARLALAPPGDRVYTAELVTVVVLGMHPNQVRVAPNKQPSAEERKRRRNQHTQIRNAQGELRRRLGTNDPNLLLPGHGKRWVALEDVEVDYHDFVRAVRARKVDEAHRIASRGEFLPGIKGAWFDEHRRTFRALLARLDGADPKSGALSGHEAVRGNSSPPSPRSDTERAGSTNADQDPRPTADQARDPRSGDADRTTELSGSAAAEPPRTSTDTEPTGSATRPTRRARANLAAIPLVLVVGGLAVALLANHSDDVRPRTSPPPSPGLPDASRVSPDIKPNGEPVVLDLKAAGLCQNVLPGVSAPRVVPVVAGDRRLAEVRTYYQAEQEKTCAKLVKLDGSPLFHRPTHLALTLCGDGNACERDWHAYKTDAGPLVVPSRNGCVSWRVSMADREGGWLVRDQVGRTGCS